MDNVNHPEHYTSHPSGVECIQITRHMSFSLGNVVKYLWRAGLKKAEEYSHLGDALKRLEDLKKAEWYLKDAIQEAQQDVDALCPPTPSIGCGPGSTPEAGTFR